MNFVRLSGVLGMAGMLVACGDQTAPVQLATPTPASVEDTVGRNLIVNGDAETTQSSDKDVDKNVPSTWSRTPDVLAMEYGSAPEEWLATKPGCPDGRRRYFRMALAINEENKSIEQNVAVAGAASAIDGGDIECALGGWFGAWVGGDASARLEVNFIDADGKKLGSIATEPPDPAVLPKPEHGRAAMMKEVAAALVPVGTRRLEVRLVAIRPKGKIDTIGVATADNLSLVLRRKS